MIEDRFETWLQSPQGRMTYTLFRKYAEAWKKANHKRCPVYLLLARIRWELGTKTRHLGIGIDNEHVPCLARKLVQDHPEEYQDFFVFNKKDKS